MTSPLFQPFDLARLALRNRIAMAPMTRRRSPGGVPGADVAAYYRRRAAGGVGLIVTEGITVDRPAASFDAAIPSLHGAASQAGWRAVTAGVQAEGARIAAQLWHVGLQRGAGAGPHPAEASEGPSRAGDHTMAMSDADIADTIDAFARGAVAAREAGFDAVEVHGAHGYLIDQFAWPVTNRRDDAYGGDAARRMRFAAEIVRAIRREAGALPILFRFSQWKLQDYGARLARTPRELEQLLTPLVDAGVDLLHASTRRYWQPEFDESPLGLAGWAKRLTGLPTMLVGSVGLEGGDVVGALREGEHAATVGPLAPVEARLAAGECDLVAVGRALIANPDWANLVAARRLDALRPFDKALLATL